MAKILYQGTHGTDDPTRASMPFHMALGAVEAGHTPEIGLAGDAVVCIKDNIIDSVKGVGKGTFRKSFKRKNTNLHMRGLRRGTWCLRK